MLTARMLCAGLCIASVGCAPGPRPAVAEQEERLENIRVSKDLDCATLVRLVREELGGLRAVAPGEGPCPSIQYRPAEVEQCMELASIGRDTVPIASIDRPVDASEQYVLSIPRAMVLARPDEDAFGAYLAQGLVHDLVELVDGDTVPCAFIHLESGAAMAPERKVLVGFDRPQDGRERRLLLLDRQGFFGRDLLFTFKPGVFSAYHKSISS